MRDLQVFLNWYLNPRGRMKRGMFNVVFFVAFIPVIFIKVMDMAENTTQKAGEYAPVMNMLKDGLSGKNNIDSRDVQGFLRKSESTRNATRQMMDAFDFQSLEKASVGIKEKPKSGLDLGDFLSFLIYLGLIPIVMMRLRDLGKWGNALYVYTAVVYSGILVDSAKSLLHMDFPISVSAAASILTFVLVSWLCMGGSRIRPSEIHREDNYMPGDNPDDPY